MIEKYLDRAEEELQKITPENLDFFHTLIQAAEMRLLIAFYMPHIMRDESRLFGVRKNRRGRWPELDDWIRQKLLVNPKVSAKELWRKIPGPHDLSPFYLDGETIATEQGQELGFKGFQTRITMVKKSIKNPC